MGSGSAGGGGGGSGGATRGGGVGYGGYQIRDGNLVIQNVNATKKATALQGVLRKLRPEYLHDQFINSSAREIYGELCLLGVDLALNRSWTGIANRLGVKDGPGCLPRLISALMLRFEASDGNRKSRAFVRMALENFLLRVVRDDLQLYGSATSAQILGQFDRNVFDHLSGLFLGDLLYEVIRGEERALPPEVKTGLRAVVQASADGVVNDFAARFRNKPLGAINQVSYPHLFDVIAAKEDWFFDQLRK